MDELENKTYKSYDYISRYISFPFYYNTYDDKFIYGLTSQLNTQTEYVLHTVKKTDNLDKLSLQYYGRPDLYWAIADFNKIKDPYTELFSNYKTLKIPTLSSIEYKGTL